MTLLKDSHGLGLTGASDAGRAAYEAALVELQCYRADPVATIDRAIEADPGFAMAHAFKAWLHLLGTEPGGLAVARRHQARAAAAARTRRETGHAAALAALASDRWREAGRILEDVTAEHPHDGLALLAGHQIDFFTGDARMLRDRIARAMPAWDSERPGFHSLLGMRAFGLEETGAYAAAEAFGRMGVEIEPRDGWSQHAVAHVLEMQNRSADGVAWMRASEAWADESFFAVHNWWHLALYHLELGAFDEVLALFDDKIAGGGLVQILDMVDASAMLWRLRLRGVEVGGRWDKVADRWAEQGEAGRYAFNDLHMLIAQLGAGRRAEAAETLAALEAACAGPGDNADFSREVGLPAARAIWAFDLGDWGGAVAFLRPIRSIAHRFGGSHAQRDLLDLTLIEAAIRGGFGPLARALAAERAAMRHESPLSALFLRRSQALAA